jgi:hypothetical protein
MKKFILSTYLFLFCSISYADVSTGLVGWWKLIDGSGTTCLDSSGNANTGTTHNAPTWVAGHIGSFALNFVTASNQYVNTATATNIPKINAAQTLSAWVNLTAGGAGTTRDILVPELNGSGANQLRINGANHPEVSEWGGAITITGATTPSTGVWHMITWTYDGTTNRIYVDGVQDTTSATTPQNFTPTAVIIGSYGGAGNENFWGAVDDCRIYNRALSAADVAQLFQYTGNRGFFTVIDR